MLTVRRNLIAWLALFFALTGTGIAASRYVITSPTQIKPSVLRKLQGSQGSQGEPGPQGLEGPIGAMGPAASPGREGKEGPQGPRGEMGPAGEGGSVGPMGPQGEQGPAGPQGERGSEGDQGLQGREGSRGEPGTNGEPAVAFYSYHGAALELPLQKETQVVGLQLPGGNYLMHSTVTLQNQTTVTAYVGCHLEATNSSVDKTVSIGAGESGAYLHPGLGSENGGPGGSTETVGLEGAFEGNFETGFESTVSLICDKTGGELSPVNARDASVSAIKVEHLTEG